MSGFKDTKISIDLYPSSITILDLSTDEETVGEVSDPAVLYNTTIRILISTIEAGKIITVYDSFRLVNFEGIDNLYVPVTHNQNIIITVDGILYTVRFNVRAEQDYNKYLKLENGIVFKKPSNISDSRTFDNKTIYKVNSGTYIKD